MKPKPVKHSLRFSARGDVRVSAGGLRRLSKITRGAHPLAATIVRRYANTRRLGAWLDLVLRRPPPQRAWQPVHRHRVLAIASKLFLNVRNESNWRTNEVQPTGTNLRGSVWPTVLEREVLPPESGARPVPEREVRHILVERLVSRQVRREIGDHQLGKTSSLRRITQAGREDLDPQLLDRPIHRIFRKQTPTVTVQSSPTPDSRPPFTRTVARPFAHSIRNAVAVNVPESIPSTLLMRITDHVIETIDHRITAGRERRGKV
jgi:hypothetical protein